MATNLDSITTLDKVIDVLTDYHANGAYETLKENVTLLDKESYAVMIRTTNFESNNFKDNLIYVDEHAYNYLKKSKVYASDLIMNKIANPGTVYFMPKLDKPVSLGMNLFLIRINTEKANPYFIYAYLKKNEHYVKSFASGSTTKTITKDDVRRLQIYCPPIEEQNKIAEILSTWDKAIETVEKLVANSQQQKKALMQQLLTGQKRLLDENGVKFGDEWAKLSFGDFGKCIRGVSYKPEDIVSEENENTIRLLRSTNIQEGSLNDKDLVILPKDKVKSTQILKNTDLAVCMANGSKSLVGKSAPFNHSEKVYTVGAFCAVFRPEKNVSAKFVKFLFESEYYFSQISLILAGSSINNLKGSDIEAITFLAPKNIHEQEKIAQVLTLADREIDLYQQQLDKLKLEKKSLMQQLLTGQKRVKLET